MNENFTLSRQGCHKIFAALREAIFEGKAMKPCPECGSDKVYRYKESIDALGGHGPDLLPKLSSGIFSPAKFVPVVCMACGLVRFYASKEARYKLETSEHWQPA